MEVNRVKPQRPSSSPPRPNSTEISVPLTALWEKIPREEQRCVLRVFGNILLRKLHAPPASKEVTHEKPLTGRAVSMQQSCRAAS